MNSRHNIIEMATSKLCLSLPVFQRKKIIKCGQRNTPSQKDEIIDSYNSILETAGVRSENQELILFIVLVNIQFSLVHNKISSKISHHVSLIDGCEFKIKIPYIYIYIPLVYRLFTERLIHDLFHISPGIFPRPPYQPERQFTLGFIFFKKCDHHNLLPVKCDQ